MKCVSKEEFLKLPAGTVYVTDEWRYDVRVKESCFIGSMPIAIDTDYGEYIADDDDFRADYSDDEMFYIYEESDILKLKEFVGSLQYHKTS